MTVGVYDSIEHDDFCVLAALCSVQVGGGAGAQQLCGLVDVGAWSSLGCCGRGYLGIWPCRLFGGCGCVWCRWI